MNIKRTLGEKGQVVVPKDIREHLGIKPGSEIVFEMKEREIVIRPARSPKEFVENFCSIIPKKYKKRLDISKIKKTIDKQYEEEYNELHRR